MIRSRTISVACASALLAACGAGESADRGVPAVDPAPPADAAAVRAADAWVRAADRGAMTAAYLTLSNSGVAVDTVLGVVTDAAEAASIHQSSAVGGTMHMTRLMVLPIPVGTPVTLAPLGTHLMLEGLRRALRAGDSLSLRLVLASGDTLPVTAVTRAP